MCDYITQYIKGCAMCQMNKVNTNPTKPPLYPITPVTNALPFQTIALDFIMKLPESDGYDTICCAAIKAQLIRLMQPT
jgi:hypothetical protein